MIADERYARFSRHLARMCRLLRGTFVQHFIQIECTRSEWRPISDIRTAQKFGNTSLSVIFGPIFTRFLRTIERDILAQELSESESADNDINLSDIGRYWKSHYRNALTMHVSTLQTKRFILILTWQQVHHEKSWWVDYKGRFPDKIVLSYDKATKE